MKNCRAPIAALVVSAWLVTGCGSIDKLKEGQSAANLQDHLARYESTLRWQSPKLVYKFLKPELAAQTPIPESINNIKVTHYETDEPPVFVSKTKATQKVTISYIVVDRQVARELVDSQVWERSDENTDKWYRSNPVPEFPQ